MRCADAPTNSLVRRLLVLKSARRVVLALTYSEDNLYSWCTILGAECYMRCKYCGVPSSYYSCSEHSHRQSCLVSESGFHTFVWELEFYVITVYNSVFTVSNHA